jgi:hypothetical protein
VAADLLAKAADQPRQPFIGGTYASKAVGEERHYRIFLPADYNTNNRKWADRGGCSPVREFFWRWSSYNDFTLDKAAVAACPNQIGCLRLPLGYRA